MTKRMKLLIFNLIFLHQLYGHASPHPISQPNLILGEAEQRLLHIPGLKRFSIGSQEVARAIHSAHLHSKDHLLIKGIKKGITDLWVWKSDGTSEFRTIEVIRWKQSSQTRSALEDWVKLIHQAEVIPTHKGLLLRGEITQLKELKTISSLKRHFTENVIDETHPSSDLLSEGKSKLESWISTSKWKNEIQVTQNHNSLSLNGILENEAEKSQALKSAELVFPALINDLDTLSQNGKTIYFRVFLIELRKSEFDRLGIQWPAEQLGAFSLNSRKIFENIEQSLNLEQLSKDGRANILAKPELVVRAPGSASLFAGGEIPIHEQSKYTSKISWKPYGLTLKLNVTDLKFNSVSVDVNTELSYLDIESGSADVPGIRLNRMNTQIQAEFGKAVLLCGLIQEHQKKQITGLPILKNLPILGALFSSQEYQKNESELVAVLIPQSKLPTHTMARIDSEFPKGKVPPSRNWISPTEEKKLRAHPSFPWNVLR